MQQGEKRSGVILGVVLTPLTGDIDSTDFTVNDMSNCKRGTDNRTRLTTLFAGSTFGALLLILIFVPSALLAQSDGTVNVVAPDPYLDPVSPSPVPVNTPAEAQVSALVTNPPTQQSNDITVSWEWTVGSVQYTTLEDGTWGDPPAGVSYTVSLGTSTDTYTTSVNTLTGSFGAAGYWLVPVTATVTYTSSSEKWTGSASMSVVFTVYSLTISPSSIWVSVGGTASATGTVVPPDFASSATFSTTDSSIATVTAGSPTGGSIPLTITGVQAGTTQLQGSMGSGPAATANITVGTFSLTAEHSAICAGGIATPIHQTLLTAVLTDNSGTPLQGQQITFSTTAGTLNPTSAVTDSNGVATTTLTSSSEASDPYFFPPAIYVATVTAKGPEPSQSAQAQVEFQPTQPTLTVDPNSIMVGETSTLTLQLAWNDQAVAQHSIAFYISRVWDEYGNEIYDGLGTPPSGYGSIESVQSQTDSTGTATAQYVAGSSFGTVEITGADTSVFYCASNGQNPQAKANVNIVWILVDSISFNTGNPPCVTLTKVNPPFANPPLVVTTPEWVRVPLKSDPVAYVRNNTFTMKVNFSGGPPNMGVRIRAITNNTPGSAGSASGNAVPINGTNAVNVPFDNTGKGQGTFTTAQALGNWVDIDSIIWQWQYLDPKTNKWTNMGASAHMIYVVDQNPLATSDGRNYVDVVSFGCFNARGKATVAPGDQVFDAIWAAVQTRNVYGWKYWGPFASAANFPRQQNTTRGLICNGDDKCGAWGSYFSDVCAVQGIAVPTFPIFPPASGTAAPAGGVAAPGPFPLLFIKNLMAGGAYNVPPNPSQYLTITAGGKAGITWNNGIPAQGLANPGRAGGLPFFNWWIGKSFTDHCLTYRDSNGNRKRDAGEAIYDPSYGNTFANFLNWQTASVGGFGNGFNGLNMRVATNYWWDTPKAPAVLQIRIPPRFAQ